VQRRTKKREQLLTAASELFCAHGMRRVSITEICQEAAVSKVTFYKYFDDKNAIAREVIDVLSDRILERLDDIEAMDAPFSDKVQRFVEERTQLARDLSPTFISELHKPESDLREFFAERSRKNARHFVAFLERAQQSGDVKKDLPPALILAVLEQLNRLGRDDTLVDACGGYARMTKALNEMFFDAISAS